MVELALVAPLFLLLIFGGITAALAYEHKADIVHAVRDGARVGSTVPLTQCDTTSNCDGRTWAGLVQQATVDRSEGALSSGNICVALVNGSTGAIYNGDTGKYLAGANGTTGCFNDGNSDKGCRVHVSAVRSGEKINLVVSTLSFTLSSKGVARYEQC